MGSSTVESTVEPRTSDKVEVAVVGAGQAGLVMGYFLRRQGRRAEYQKSKTRQAGEAPVSAGARPRSDA